MREGRLPAARRACSVSAVTDIAGCGRRGRACYRCNLRRVDDTMHELPLVSVIIPTHNRASLIRECIGSALNQDYPHVEAIVIDDGSTDNTSQIINSLSNDPRVVYRLQA